MKNIIYLVFLLPAVCCTTPTDDTSCADWISYPCGTENIDIKCVGAYLDRYSNCRQVSEPRDCVVVEENFPIYLPKVNLTAVTTKTTLSNLDGTIEKFYFNSNTGYLVISVNYQGLRCDAETLFAFSQKGKEPKVFTDIVNATYAVILTALIPASHGITVHSLRTANYFAHFPDTSSSIIYGPKFTGSKDSLVRGVLAGMNVDPQTALQEIFRQKAAYCFLTYLQNYICDFNISPVLETVDMTVFNRDLNINVDNDQYHVDPCECSDDYFQCVLDWFERNAKCNVVRNPSDAPENRGRYTLTMPTINSSLYATNAEWRQGSLRGRLDAFYINRATNNLVMSVAFKAIEVFTPMVHLIKNIRGQEPLIVSDYSTHIYPVTLTAVIPITKSPITVNSLRRAFVTGYFYQPTIFAIGPKFTESTNPEMIKNVQEVEQRPMQIGQECMLTEAPTFFVTYLQKYICHFNIPNASFPDGE